MAELACIAKHSSLFLIAKISFIVSRSISGKSFLKTARIKNLKFIFCNFRFLTGNHLLPSPKFGVQALSSH
jgi:hypothetical protein